MAQNRPLASKVLKRKPLPVSAATFRCWMVSWMPPVSWATGSETRPLDSTVPPETVPGAWLGSEVEIHYSKFTFLLGFVFGS